MTTADAPRWVLLIHQIPPRPSALRVKVWRQLQRIGAVAIKSSVYALPLGEAGLEDFHWVARAITDGGGDASICEARFAGGLTDEQIVALFMTARDADYAQLAEDARRLDAAAPVGGDEADRARLEAEVTRLARRLAEVVAIDFFGAPGRDVADGLVTELERRARRPRRVEAARGGATASYRGRTWVTREGVHIDRIASAWLIRRSIDPEARFRFVAAGAPVEDPAELRFDMFDAAFTHEGDRCTFEVLVERFALDEPGLQTLAEIIHDLDLKDGKFGHPETAGVASVVAGLALVHRDDEARLAHGATLFDALLAQLGRARAPGPASDPRGP